MTVDELNQRLEAAVSATIRVMVDLYADELQQLETERKKGKWVHMVGWWECNQCHAEYTDMPTCMGKVIYEYCPMCGAKMEVDNG